MSTNYLSLKGKIGEMQQELERARQAELPGILASIKKQIEEYQIQPQELYPGLRAHVAPARSERVKRDRPPKYQSPLGEQWSGGPGRKPKWVIAIEKAGEDLEKYRIPETR